jgi:hypothetical protein
MNNGKLTNDGNRANPINSGRGHPYEPEIGTQ